jgi:hypothetical protein
MTDEIKSKLVRISIDEKGWPVFYTPNGDRIPGIISSKIESEVNDGGFKVVTLTFHAYMEEKK